MFSVTLTAILAMLLTFTDVTCNLNINGSGALHINGKIKEAIAIVKSKEAVSFEEKEEMLDNSNNTNLLSEVEALFVEEVNARIAEFQDLKTQIAVIERHLRKHPDFKGFNTIDSMLVDLGENEIKKQEEELAELKDEIVNSDHALNASDVKVINTMVHDAERFLEANIEKVNSVLDVHIASFEHKHEHDDGSPLEKAADYLDLINDDETYYVALDEDEAELLIEYIDMDIKEFQEIENRKMKFEEHIKKRSESDQLKSGELQLKVAREVLKDVSLQDIKSYEENLQLLKHHIQKSKGLLNVNEIEEMSSVLEIAEAYVEESKDKLKLLGVLELEFEVFKEVESNIMPPKPDSLEDDDITIEEFSSGESNNEHSARNISEVASGLDEVKIGGRFEHKSVDKEIGKEDKEVVEESTEEKKVQVSAEEEDDKVLHNVTDMGGERNSNTIRNYDSVMVEDLPLPINFSVPVLVIMMLVVVLVLAAVYRVCCRARNHQLGSCEVGYGDNSHLLARKGYKSSKLDVVNEDNEWSSNDAARSKSGRRKRM